MAGSNRASTPPRSRRSAPRSSGRGRAAAPKRKLWDYPRTGYHGLHRWLPSWRVVLGTMLAGVFLMAGAVFAAYATIEVPQPGEDVEAQTTTVYYADNPDGTPGPVMGTYAVQKREIVPFETLPAYVGNAVVANEDQTFWENSGVSITGMGRALLHNLRKAEGESNQGGSTLTQQYVERYLVGQTTSDYVGKAKEALLAVKVAKTKDKKEILGGYLNTIYFGRDSYGIQAASKSYFGVPAAELTLSQAAVLAAIIPAPNAWDPAVNPKQAEARWNMVLDRMVAGGFATAQERAQAQFPDTVEYKRSAKYQGPQGYLLKMVEDEMAKEPIAIDKEKLDRRGLKVVTTIQKPVQAEAERTAAELIAGSITDGEAPSPNLHPVITSVDPATGGIVALYGGPDYVTSAVNWATYGNGIQGGSTFKPFTLVAALEQGVTLEDRFSGKSPMKLPGWDSKNKPVTNFGNSSYGMMDLTSATANSVNTVYAQLNLQIGPENTALVAQRAGVSTPINKLPGNVLGTATVHPLDMASAYATFAAQGIHRDVHIVAKVLNNDDSVRYEAKTAGKQEFAPDVMADATYAMTQVVQKGSGEDYIKPLKVPVAGKTGTSTENISAWFVGYTPTIATAVALSQTGDDGKTQVTIDPVGKSAGRSKLKQVTGGSIPARTWANYMKPVLAMPQFAKDTEFPERTNKPRPHSSATATAAPTVEPTIEATPEDVNVPNQLAGKLQADATAAIVALGLSPVIVSEPSSDVPVGRVIRTEPGPGALVPGGSSVTLVISSGPPTPTAPPTPDPTSTATPPPGTGSSG